MARLVWDHDMNGVWTDDRTYWFGHVFSEYEPASFSSKKELKEFMKELEKFLENV